MGRTSRQTSVATAREIKKCRKEKLKSKPLLDLLLILAVVHVVNWDLSV